MSYCKSSTTKDKFILELITTGYKRFWSRLVSLQNVKMSIFRSSYRSKFLQNKHIQETYIYNLIINKNVHTNPSIFRCFWTPSYFCSKKPIISSKCHQKKQNTQSRKEASKKYPHTQFHYRSYLQKKKTNPTFFSYLRRSSKINKIFGKVTKKLFGEYSSYLKKFLFTWLSACVSQCPVSWFVSPNLCSMWLTQAWQMKRAFYFRTLMAELHSVSLSGRGQSEIADLPLTNQGLTWNIIAAGASTSAEMAMEMQWLCPSTWTALQGT